MAALSTAASADRWQCCTLPPAPIDDSTIYRCQRQQMAVLSLLPGSHWTPAAMTGQLDGMSITLPCIRRRDWLLLCDTGLRTTIWNRSKRVVNNHYKMYDCRLIALVVCGNGDVIIGCGHKWLTYCVLVVCGGKNVWSMLLCIYIPSIIYPDCVGRWYVAGIYDRLWVLMIFLECSVSSIAHNI